MISNRTQVRIKRGKTSTTISREDGELNAADVLSTTVINELRKHLPDEVQAIYIEVIAK